MGSREMSKANRFPFTIRRLEAIEPPAINRATYYDDHPQGAGLALRVTPAGTKSFYVIQWAGTQAKFVSLGGKFPGMTIEQARKLAADKQHMIQGGIDPVKAKKAAQARSIALGDVLEDYLSTRPNLAANTVTNYRRELRLHLEDWKAKPLLEITRDMVQRRHKKLSQTSPTAANGTMRLLRALFNFAHGQYEDEKGEPLILHNPVTRLSHVKAWNKETRRTDHIRATDLAAWWQAVDTMPGWFQSYDPFTPSAYLKLVLLTGLRRREAASIRKDWLDLEQATMTIPSTHTKNSHDHSLPLTGPLLEIIRPRLDSEGPFLFPGNGRSGHLEEPHKAVEAIRARTGLSFTVHGLRRTFITQAEACNVRDYTLKRLLNHRSGGDVTDGYLMDDVERLREPMEAVHRRILALGTKSAASNVVELHRAS